MAPGRAPLGRGRAGAPELVYGFVVQVVVTDRHPWDVAGDAVALTFRARRRGPPSLPAGGHLPPRAAALVAREEDACTWFDLRRSRAGRALVISRGAGRQLGRDGCFGSLGPVELAHREAHDQRVVGALVEQASRSAGVRSLVLAPDAEVDPVLLLEGLLLRAHDPRDWEVADSRAALRKITICRDGRDDPALASRVQACTTIADSVNFARRLADAPGNVATPTGFVREVRRRLAGTKVGVEVISAARARAFGMGLFSAVDAGASRRGCILVMTIEPPRVKAGPPLVFVGKGVTFDTGGLNIKTSANLHLLTHDKCGATAVVGAMDALARLGTNVPVVGVCPIVENAVGPAAMRPGDILRALDGTTVYVQNTDAEGRLLLGDVLAWVARRRPGLVVDLATLTGQATTALGEPLAAMFSNDDEAALLVREAALAADEPVWPMPIHEVHDRELAHPKADLRNVTGGPGDACAAAAFLRHFVDYPWAHLDMGGQAHATYAREYWSVGATGFGVRLLVEVARRYAQRTRR
jgi:leucyl aminopeptidase